jgi:hypothetical protein
MTRMGTDRSVCMLVPFPARLSKELFFNSTPAEFTRSTAGGVLLTTLSGEQVAKGG